MKPLMYLILHPLHLIWRHALPFNLKLKPIGDNYELATLRSTLYSIISIHKKKEKKEKVGHSLHHLKLGFVKLPDPNISVIWYQHL